MAVCEVSLSGHSDPYAFQGAALCLSLAVLRSSLLHHATLRLPAGTRSVSRRSRCASDDDCPSRSFAPAPHPFRRKRWRGARPIGSRHGTDRLAVARDLVRRGPADCSDCAFPSTGAGPSSEARTAVSYGGRKIRAARRISDVYPLGSLLDVDASGVGP